MVIQTCSEIFAVLMQLDGHANFSADALSTHLSHSDSLAAHSQKDIPAVISNDRTTLPFQK